MPTLPPKLKPICTNPSLLKQIQAFLLKQGLLSSLSLSLSRLSSLLRILSANSHFLLSLRLFSSLRSPDNFAFPFALNSAAALSHLHLGRAIHAHLLLSPFSSDPYCNAALIDMYSKCAHVSSARHVFDGMPQKDPVSWTSMISAYANNGYASDTLSFFNLMLHSCVHPGRVGLLSALSASGSVHDGGALHGFALRNGFTGDIRVATAVCDMYAKCGSLELAELMFDLTAGKDVVCWSAMIACYGYHGLGEEAIGVFKRMVEDGVKPNGVTFANLLSSCGHSGLFREGKEIFHSMRLVYGIKPDHDHYAQVVDILGRAGKLEEAVEIVEKMPMSPGASIYGSLLGACQIHGDIDLGEKIADKLLELCPDHSGYYVLLSNIYAANHGGEMS